MHSHITHIFELCDENHLEFQEFLSDVIVCRFDACKMCRSAFMANARYDRFDAASSRCNGIARHAPNCDGVVSLSSWHLDICFCFTLNAM